MGNNNESITSHFDFATRIGVDGKGAYEIAVTNGFIGTEVEWIASIRQPALDAEIQVLNTNREIAEAESIRINAENSRIPAEIERARAESSRIVTESSRQTNTGIAISEANKAIVRANDVAIKGVAATNNTIRATSNAVSATTNANTATSNANRASNSAEGATESANRATEGANAATIEALDAANVASTMIEEDLIKQDLVSPFQARYTFVSTPKEDNTVKWSGNLASIALGDFTIQFCGAFDNANTSTHCACKLGSGTILSNIDSIFVDSSNPANALSDMWFPPRAGASYSTAHIPINKTKLPYKTHCVIFGRAGNEGFVYNDGGERRTVDLTRVMEISNLLTLSNASALVLVRKFNFAADDAFAKLLYNNGRWCEKNISSEYRSDSISTIIPLPYNFKRPVNDGVATLVNNANATVLSVTTVGSNIYNPAIELYIPNYMTDNLFVDVEVNINIPNGGTVTIPRTYSGTMITPPVGYSLFQEVGSGSYNLTFDSINSNLYNTLTLYTDGRTLATYTVKKLKIYTKSLQNEYLPSSITKTTWRDTQGTSNLTPSSADKMVFETEPILDSVITGLGAPTFAPDAVGQQYIDTQNRVKYSACGTLVIEDWIA